MWSPLKGSAFDLCNSSMSAAVQELYTGLPVALSTKCSALSDPTLILDEESEESAFVLSCSSSLPSQRQRTYELNLCSPDPHDRPDNVGQMPGPSLVELLSKESGTVVLAGNEEAHQDGRSADQEYLSEDAAEAAKIPRGVAEEGCAPALETAYWSKEEEPQLLQEGRECLLRPFHTEKLDSLQSIEESQPDSPVATENPMKEAPGRKANRTVFGKAGESSSPLSPGVPPETRKCSEVEAVTAKVEVSETSTLVSLEPEDVPAKEHLRGEEESQRLKATSSALCLWEAEGEQLSNQDQNVGAPLGHILPSHQEKMDLHNYSSPASDLEIQNPLPIGSIPQMSNCPLFQRGSELVWIPWEEEMDVVEVVCETQEESPLSDERCLGCTAPCGKTPLLEEISLLAASSGMEEFSNTEQEVGKWTDHSYCCHWEGSVNVEKGNTMQSSWKTGGCSEGGQQELQVWHISKAQNTHSETDTFCLLDVGRSSPKGHSDDGLELTFSGSESVQRNKDQQYSLPKEGAIERSASPGKEECFLSKCTTRTFPLPVCLVPFKWDHRSCEEPLQPEESAGNQRTQITTSATSLHAVHSSSTTSIHHVSTEEILPKAQRSDEHSFPPENGTISSPGEFPNSLPKEALSGTCACLLCKGSAGPYCGGCTERSRESQQCAAPGLCKMEERPVGMQTVESHKCSPTDQRVNSPYSAAERDILGTVCLDEGVLTMRNETTNEEVDGLEMCNPLVLSSCVPPLEHSSIEAQNSPSYKNEQSNLDGTENSSASLCCTLTGTTNLTGAEVLASAAKVEGEGKANNSCRNTEEMLDVDTHVGPPDTNLQHGLRVVSLMAGPGRTEAMGSGKGKEDNLRNGENEKSQDSGHMVETVHCPELGGCVKDQCEESEVPVNHPHHLHRGRSWNLEVETPEREALKGEQYRSKISGWLERDCAAHSLTCSETPKSPNFSQNESLDLPSNSVVTIQPEPVLITPNDTPPNRTVSCFSNETASASVSEPLELKNSEPSLESEWKEWTDEAKTDNFCSALLEVSPADVQEKIHSLMLLDSDSAPPSDQTYLHAVPIPLVGPKGENSTERASSGVCQNKLSRAHPVQNPRRPFSQKGPSIPLYPSVLYLHPVPAPSLGNEGDHHVGSLTSGNEKRSHSPQVGSCIGCPLHSKEDLSGMTGSNVGTAIGGKIISTTPCNVNLSRKTAPSLEGHLRRGSIQITRVSKMGNCPEPAAYVLQKKVRGCPYRYFASFDRLKAKPKRQVDRLLKSSVRQPLSGPFGKSEVPARRAVGRITEDRQTDSVWSTSQESKRPKISKDSVELDCLEAGSSCLSEKNCGWTSTGSNAPLTPVFNKQTPIIGSGWDRIGNAFGSAHKKQRSHASSRPPCKAWKKHSGLVQFKAAGKSTPLRSFKRLLEGVPLPPHKHVDRVSSAVRRWAPKSRAIPNSLLDSVEFGQLAQDKAVLRRLSLLADGLLTPPRSRQSHSTKLLPLTGQSHWLSNQKLLDIFSCVNLPLNSWEMSHSNCSLKTLSSPPFTLFLVESLDLCFWDSGRQTPFSVSTPLVPVLFNMKVDLFPRRNIHRITSLQNQVVVGKRDAVKSWSWMLSFLFPGGRVVAAPVEEDPWISPNSSLCAKKDKGEDAIAQKSTGIPPHGLQTVLALSSPRYHRIWKKKQPQSDRRTLSTQKLIVLQFVQSLKGSNCSSPATVDFSIPHLLGRGLSLQNHYSPSTRFSDYPPLFSDLSTWPPVTPTVSSLSIRNRITPNPSAASFHFANVQQKSGLKTSGSGCTTPCHLNQSPRLQFSVPLLQNIPHGKHPAMLLQMPEQIFGAPCVVATAAKVEPPLPALLPTPCLDSEPALSSLALSTSEFPVCPLDGLDVSPPVVPKTGSCFNKTDSEKKPKKVSQIRIRKTIPKPDPNLTPMGLPRPKRLKKKEFSLEEIYTNKNYKSPPTTRCLETIFEEPKEKNGSLISVSQQKRKRILEFQDFTIPRKRRVRSRVKVLGSFTRAQKAALEGRELDVLLVQKLTDLETFFAEEEKEEVSSS